MNRNIQTHIKTGRLRNSAVAITLAATLIWGAMPASAKHPDTRISQAVEDEYIFDRVVPFNDVDVITKEGIVTLSGETQNILAKERAAALAETVRGVRSVINLIKVRPRTDISGEQLGKDVNLALARDPATDSWEVQVQAEDTGRVTLDGEVQSWQEKRLCATVAKGVRGVTEVRNRIKVDHQTDRSDYELKHEIAKRLDWDVLVDAGWIDVKVNDGKVKLSGVVGSAAEKRQAIGDSWVRGVESVNAEQLKVRDWADIDDTRHERYVTRTDEQIRQAVTDAFVYDPRVFSFNVTPTVRDGWVTLTGTVDNALAKEAAEGVAHRTTGVYGVVNRLKVRSALPLTDEQIEANLEQKFALDPWVESFEIHTDVVFGVAFLRGTVDSWFEKTRAETLAYGAKGVKTVENRLKVEDPERMVVYDPFIWSMQPHPWRYHPHHPTSTKIYSSANDGDIAEEIKDELFWSPFVDADQVNVRVVAGVATLTGTVDSNRERSAATENAWEGGATAVVNKLKVKQDDGA